MPNEKELRDQIIEKAWSDAEFKEQLLADPKAAISEAFGVDIPAEINLEVLAESSDKYYLVLPQNPAVVSADSQVEVPRWQ